MIIQECKTDSASTSAKLVFGEREETVTRIQRGYRKNCWSLETNQGLFQK